MVTLYIATCDNKLHACIEHYNTFIAYVPLYRMAHKFYIARIKFYGFAVAGRIIKLKSVNLYYYVAKILSCFYNRKV